MDPHYSTELHNTGQVRTKETNYVLPYTQGVQRRTTEQETKEGHKKE